MFSCDQCGLCCMQIGGSALYDGLNRGDGICIFFDEGTRICQIYDNRPLLCNVDKVHETYCKEKITQDEYYELNYRTCKRLKENCSRRKQNVSRNAE